MLKRLKLHYIGNQAKLGKNVEVDYGAYVGDGTKIGHNVRIGSFAQVLYGSVIEDNCIIGSHCVISHPSKLEFQKTDFSSTSPKVVDFIIEKPIVRIGAGSIIRSGATIYKYVVVGKNLRTGHSVLVREHVSLGNDCILGTQAILDGYIKIDDNSMIQSQCYIAQSVRIGKGVFIAPGCIFMDNKNMVLGKGLQGVEVEDYVRIGGGTKVLPGITIGKYALVGAGAIVTKDVPPKAIAYGAPAEVKGFLKKAQIKAYIDSITTWNR